MTRTFIYKGDQKALRVQDSVLQHGQPFTTDDPVVIEELSVLVDVEEVKSSERKEEPKKPSKKNDADES